MRGPLLLLLLLIVGVSGVYSGVYNTIIYTLYGQSASSAALSLHYYRTGVSVPGYGLPEYVSVAYVDGIEITRYSSDVGRLVPVVHWMKKLGPEYWETNTQNCKGHEAIYKHTVKTLMSRFNHTGGFHSYQCMFGCELRDDGSTRGFDQHGFDGKDFLALDTERGVYYPLTDQAQVTTQRWNSPEVREGERQKNYLEIECIDWLKKHKKERRVPVRPEVKVSNQNVNGVTKLHCQVYGFYPRDVDVNWMRNGMDVPSDEAKYVLPNSDGTFQIRVTVEAAAEDLESYSCHVDHVSLTQILTVKSEQSSHSNLLRIVIGVCAGAIASAVIGFVIWRKRSGKKTYAPTNTSDKEGSSTSSSA